MTTQSGSAAPGFDNAQAFAEGWGLFEMPDTAGASFLAKYGRWSLDALAEGNTVGPVVFGEDAKEAWGFVVAQAIAGSTYHRSALAFLREHNPKEIAFMRDDVPAIDQVH